MKSRRCDARARSDSLARCAGRGRGEAAGVGGGCAGPEVPRAERARVRGRCGVVHDIGALPRAAEPLTRRASRVDLSPLRGARQILRTCKVAILLSIQSVRGTSQGCPRGMGDMGRQLGSAWSSFRFSVHGIFQPKRGFSASKRVAQHRNVGTSHNDTANFHPLADRF